MGRSGRTGIIERLPQLRTDWALDFVVVNGENATSGNGLSETHAKALLEAGADVQEHCDPTLDARFREVVRLTVPVFSDEDTLFLLDKSPVPMQPGELWYLRLSELHSVHNRSPRETLGVA